MRYAFFTNTPAHVHLYRNAVRRLAATDDVLVLGRDYGCTRTLLEHYDLPFELYGSCDTTKRSLFTSLPGHFLGIARAARRFRPDLIFGVGAYAAFAGAVARSPTVLVLDSEPTTVDHLVSRPFVRAILTPAVFGKDLGARHYRFQGFKECAYLHPEEFDPDRSVRTALGVDPDEPYAIVRFNAFGSHHDVGQRGFTPDERNALVERIADHAAVFVSREGDWSPSDDPAVRPYQLHPARMHDALAEASLLVADSQTMVTEAALLGTPAIRSNSFVGASDMGNFVELERRGLVWNIRAFDAVLEAVTAVLTDEALAAQWQARRDDYVTGLVNLTDLIVDVAAHAGTVEALAGVSPDSSTPAT